MTDQTEEEITLLSVEVNDDLAALLQKYPLPEGVEDADMNQSELASAFNTSVNSISKWISKNMPVVVKGGNGQQYVLRLSHCYAWKKAQDAHEEALRTHASNQASALQASFLGLDISDPDASMTAAQRREAAQADIIVSKARHMRGQLVQVSDLVPMLERIMVTIRDKIEALPDVLERELSLKPEEVTHVQRIGNDLLTDLTTQIEEAELTEQHVPDLEVLPQLTF